MYGVFVKRHVIEGMERRRDGMIAALWANSNYDDDKGTRSEAIASIEASYEEAMTIVRTGRKHVEEDDVDLHNNPFFAPAMQGAAQIETPIEEHQGGTVAEAVDSDKPFKELEIDQ